MKMESRSKKSPLSHEYLNDVFVLRRFLVSRVAWQDEEAGKKKSKKEKIKDQPDLQCDAIWTPAIACIIFQIQYSFHELPEPSHQVSTDGQDLLLFCFCFPHLFKFESRKISVPHAFFAFQSLKESLLSHVEKISQETPPVIATQVSDRWFEKPKKFKNIFCLGEHLHLDFEGYADEREAPDEQPDDNVMSCLTFLFVLLRFAVSSRWPFVMLRGPRIYLIDTNQPIDFVCGANFDINVSGTNLSFSSAWLWQISLSRWRRGKALCKRLFSGRTEDRRSRQFNCLEFSAQDMWVSLCHETLFCLQICSRFQTSSLCGGVVDRLAGRGESAVEGQLGTSCTIGRAGKSKILWHCCRLEAGLYVWEQTGDRSWRTTWRLLHPWCSNCWSSAVVCSFSDFAFSVLKHKRQLVDVSSRISSTVGVLGKQWRRQPVASQGVQVPWQLVQHRRHSTGEHHGQQTYGCTVWSSGESLSGRVGIFFRFPQI